MSILTESISGKGKSRCRWLKVGSRVGYMFREEQKGSQDGQGGDAKGGAVEDEAADIEGGQHRWTNG